MTAFKGLLFTGALAAAAVSAQPALAQDAEAGAQVFRKCATCHSTTEGQNRIGPSLFGIVGRTPASTDYRYSDAMSAFGQGGNVWDIETLRTYLRSPRTVVQGTRMAFPGIRDEAQLEDLLAYLETLR